MSAVEADRDGGKIVTGVLKMDGAGCASCAYAIERLGRKLPGVYEVRVTVGRGEIEVQHDGNGDALTAIRDIVRRIGHDAVIADSHVRGAASACCGRHKT